MQEKLIEPWLDCALHVECIGPKGARHVPQSALNLMLTREFGLDAVQKTFNRKISRELWTSERRPTKKYPISVCT